MKFDYIIMNPPYTAPKTTTSKSIQNLDELFLQKAIELADTVVSIQPATWFLNDKKRVNMLQGMHCDANIISNGYELFQNENASVRLTLGIFKVTRGSGMTVMYDGQNKRSYNNASEYSQAHQHDILETVIEKGRKLGQPGLKLYSNGPHGCTGAKTIHDNSGFIGKWTVKLTDRNPATNADIYDTIILKGKVSIPVQQNTDFKISGIFAIFDTQEEALYFRHYMMTDFVRAYIKVYRRGTHVSYAVKYIPWPDAGFSQDWDDDRIAQEIGLTDPERAELASILPDCYNIRI